MELQKKANFLKINKQFKSKMGKGIKLIEYAT